MLRKINMKIEKIGKRQEFVLIVFLAMLLVLGITVGIGTMTCGWHLVDDHEFMQYVYEMKYEGKTLIGLIDEWIKRDLSWRYEPLYYANRIISSALFGVNSVPYMILKSMEIVISFIFLYYCARLMKAEKVYAFLFAAISLIGYQSPVWWKLGPQEAQCTLLFSIGFYCMLKWLRGGRSGYAWGSIVAFLIMCNYKESFIILVPFLLMFCLYYDIESQSEKISWGGVWNCIKSRMWYYLILGLIFCTLILVIVIYVGVSDYDKVGLDASVPWEVYQEALSHALAGDLKWFKRFGIVFGMILLTYWDNFKKLWKEMLLTAVFLLPQIILFGQAGIQERYILPSSIGYALFFLVFIPNSHILSGKRKLCYQFCALLLLLAHGRVAMREADYYRYRGESVTTMLETVAEMTENKEDIEVLSCLRPNEEGNLTMHFWMGLHGYDNVYYWTEEEKLINQAYQIDAPVYYTEDELKKQSFEDMDVVVMYNQEDRHWCYTPTLELDDFTYQKCGTLDLYVRNNSGIEAVDTTVQGLKINF